MTTDNQSEPSSTNDKSAAVVKADVSQSATQTAPVSEKSSAASTAAGQKPIPTAAKPGLPLWALALLLLVTLVSAALAYLGWQWQQQQSQQAQAMQQQVQQQSQQLAMAQQQLAVLKQTGEASGAQWQQGLQGVEQRIEQHSRRLRSLSTTTRDDWLLAEAEYLLRLANQRLQMERAPQGALALLQSADQILLELDDAELFAVRDKLQRDITALKLAPSVDRSGLYLSLAALADEITALPEVPVIETDAKLSNANDAPVIDNTENLGVGQKIKANFFSAMSQLRDQVRIRHHDQPLEPLLPPDGARYLRQNMRFHLEQAQLAMLREETPIYQHSLRQAVGLLRQYFSTQERAQRIADELKQLQAQTVEAQLPAISGSLVALQEFIQRLHALDAAAGTPQLSPDAATDTSAAEKVE